jgi:hypothetical protein
MAAGQAVDFAASDIHRVVHGGGGPAITINAYSPPLWRDVQSDLRLHPEDQASGRA